MLTVQEFREAFPQFTDELFPDARVRFALTLAGKSMSVERWGELLPEGMGLRVAHYLTLEREAAKGKDGTGGINAASGAVVSSSKTVGGVSKSETRAGGASSGDSAAGQWNLTIYGQQYWQLVQLVGVGGAVV
jgi:hypothetical protein